MVRDIPPELVGGVASLPDLMMASAKSKGIERSAAEGVVNLLPAALKSAPCFLDRLTAMWRYVYGEPFQGLPGGRIVRGTHMYQEVDRLFEVISCAQRRLQPTTLAKYLAALSDPAKHEDTLVEFAPILRLDWHGSLGIEYEVPGAVKSTIDWLIRIPGENDLFLEVKNRVRDLIEGLYHLQVGIDEGTGPREPVHDPDLLFKSIEKKFPSRNASEVTQAVWIKTSLKQEESGLQSAFRQLDSERVHVAILGDWEDDVYVLANDDGAKQLIIRALRLRESRRFVFNSGEPVS